MGWLGGFIMVTSTLATYLPTVIKGWNALTTFALHHSPSTDPGFIGFVQSSGSYPTNNPPVTYTSPPDFDDFTLGALLLAGSEIYQLTNLSQTITFGALANHTYGDAPVTLSASASSGLSVSFSVLSGPASLAGNTLTITGAGTVTVRASQAGNTTYAATNVDQPFTVNPAQLTVTAQNTNRNYGASNPLFAASYDGFVNGDNVSVLTGSPSLTTSATGNSPIGAYTITAAIGTLGAANYNFTFVNGSLTVNPAALTVSADARGKVYGDADPLLTWQITGGTLVSGDTVSGLLSRAPGEHVGNYAIQQGTLTAGTNYTLSYVGANLAISPKAITVTADSKSKIYGDTDPALTYQITSGGGLVPGDNFSGSLARAAGENVGSYAITQNSLTAGTDYDLTFVGANLTITPANSANALISSLNPSSQGSNVTFTATLTPVSPATTTPTGAVQFFTNGAALSDPVTLVAGVASISTAQLPSGSNTVTAVYAGDTNFQGSTNSLVQVVTLNLQTPSTLGARNNGDGTVTITFAGTPGGQYVVQATVDLFSGEWTTVSTNMAALDTGHWTFTESVMLYSKRFYRSAIP